MLQIAYVSRSRGRMSVEEFERIHSQAAANNARDGIAGLLLADGHRFIQALEGRAEVVDACFTRIKGDHRHHSVTEILRENIDHHQFLGWSFRAFDLSGASRAIRQTIFDDVANLTNQSLRASFIGFATLAR